MSDYTFISYEKADAVPAHELCAQLEAAGLVCWIAPRDIPPGASYAATLFNGVERAAALVLLLSATTNDSPHVLREVELAVSKRPAIPIITVRLDLSEPSPDFKYHLASLQWIDASARPLTECAAVVVQVLQARIGPPAVPEVVTPEPVAPPDPEPAAAPPPPPPPVVEVPPAPETPDEPDSPPDAAPPGDAVDDVPHRPAEPDHPRPAPRRRRVSPLIAGIVAAVALAGVGVAFALGGGESPGTDTTAVAATTSAVTAASSTGTDTAATTAPSTTSASTAVAAPLHTTDHPKDGWAPTSSKALFAFAAKPQDGVVEYDFPAVKQTFRIVVHGSDLVVDVRYGTGATSRIWTRYKGERLVGACVFRRDATTRCGVAAGALNLTPAAFQTLTRQRDGYYDALVSLPDLRPLRTGGSVGAVAIDDALGYAVACAEPAGSEKLRLCVQENGLVTEMRAGANRITATSVRLGASAASLREPA